MELTRKGIKEREAFERLGIMLPGYDIEEVSQKAIEAPKWVHFGIGNIFRIFIGGIADGMLEEGYLDRGITCVETFDEEIVDKIYDPYDNLALSVILKGDGTREMKVLGSLAEAVKAANRDRLCEIFESKELQMVTYTITEKGYELTKADGTYYPQTALDIEAGPEKAKGAMAVTAAMLYHRYQNGALPLALISMDNCSQNGKLLKRSVLAMGKAWSEKGFVDQGFVDYISDETKVAFLSTMIDKITPRPSEKLADEFEAAGLNAMQPVITDKRTYIAPFVNGEKPQYVVIEDRFPAGRPALEHGFGVFLGDFNTVNLAERMKVTALLNPVHSATGPIGVVIGEDLFPNMINERPVMMKMARMVAYDEGMPMVEDPGILSPKAFVDELFEDRFPNEYLGDTNLRLSTDVSQGVGVRFGETIKAYVKAYGSAEKLTAIPLGIAGWLRYMMGIDDQGMAYELAPDPMNDTFIEAYRTVSFGEPESLKDQLRPILSNESIFRIDLYQAGIGERIENLVREMIAGPGSCWETICKYIK